MWGFSRLPVGPSVAASWCSRRPRSGAFRVVLAATNCRRTLVASRAQRAPSEEGPGVERSGSTFGSKFLREAEREARARTAASAQEAKGSEGQGGSKEAPDVLEQKTREQLRRLFKEMPGHMTATYAYYLHCGHGGTPERRIQLEPKVDKPMETFEEFEPLYRDERSKLWNRRRTEVRIRRGRRRNFKQLNTGYQEPEPVYEAEEPEFMADWRRKSIVEDCWKAEYYQHLHRKAYIDVPERQKLAMRGDRFADIAADALRRHLLDENRPVLTHELADYDNPYMMKRSALERLLQEHCVRNQLDERCMPRLLDRHPDLVKLRAEAALPPEVLEPLAAFRGDVRWHFDPRERLTQKLDAASLAFNAVLSSGGDAAAVVAAAPEKAEVSSKQVLGVLHPWRNHVGFESAVPQGVAGGTKFGQPMPALEAQVGRLRYPTLQRVAHSLPADAKWRAHVVRSIRVLERSKDWDFRSKLTAINKMKEIYDQLESSAKYTSALDEKLPLNRVPSHLKRKYARDAQYVKTFPKRFLLRKSFTRYRPSLTATAPMKISPAKINFK